MDDEAQILRFGSGGHDMHLDVVRVSAIALERVLFDLHGSWGAKEGIQASLGFEVGKGRAAGGVSETAMDGRDCSIISPLILRSRCAALCRKDFRRR